MIFFQFPNAHFPEESRPAAITVPSVRRPTVWLSPAATATISVQSPMSHWPYVRSPVANGSSVRAHWPQYDIFQPPQQQHPSNPLRHIDQTDYLLWPGGFSFLQSYGMEASSAVSPWTFGREITVQEGASLHINRKTWLVPATLLHSWDRFFPLLRHTYRRTAPPCVVLPRRTCIWPWSFSS